VEEEEEIVAPSEDEVQTDDSHDANENNGDEDHPEDSPNGESEEQPDEDETQEEDDDIRPGQSPNYPRIPHIGDLVINELMINPDAVLDKHGEWVELLNNTDDWIDLEDLRLADLGVDDIDIEAVSYDSLVIPPNGYAVICADASFWNNGGVDCDGTFHYQTFGGGFGLSNTEDEVALVNQYDQVIDFVSYGEGFAPEGTSMGVDPRDASATDNNDLDNWCEQFSFMPQGDSGSPGSTNSWCF